MWLFSLDKQYKGWTLQRISRHVLWWSFWLTFYGVINGANYEHYYGHFFLLELLMMTVKVPFVYIVVYYLLPRFLPQKKYLSLLLSTTGLAIIGMLIILQINLSTPFFFMSGQPVEFWTLKTLYRVIDLMYGASLVVVIKMLQQYAQQNRTNAQLKEEKSNAELQNLKNQLQPHFLFNTLNNIYGMVLSQNAEAANSVLRLSDIMSYMLHDCKGALVDLEQELALIKNYIELEKLRYGNRLDLSLEVAGNLRGKMVPPLLLLPFVENAFKHGASASERGSWIRINLQLAEQELIFLIENSVPEAGECTPCLKSGIGLANVKKRLELLYPQRHSLKIVSEDTYLVNLTIQL